MRPHHPIPSFLFGLGMILILAACGEQENPCRFALASTPVTLSGPAQDQPLPVLDPLATPTGIEIKNRTVLFDRVIQGPLCNDRWSGTVYVTCDVQVYPWSEHPTFLQNCALEIEPDTVVYVAAHNDTAYYNGCSCHTGEIAEP
jgi:hypothetical protein